MWEWGEKKRKVKRKLSTKKVRASNSHYLPKKPSCFIKESLFQLDQNFFRRKYPEKYGARILQETFASVCSGHTHTNKVGVFSVPFVLCSLYSFAFVLCLSLIASGSTFLLLKNSPWFFFQWSSRAPHFLRFWVSESVFISLSSFKILSLGTALLLDSHFVQLL